MLKTKVCSKCKAELDITSFPPNKKQKYGVGSICRECRSVLYYYPDKERIKDKSKKWYDTNREEALQVRKEYRETHKKERNTYEAKRKKEDVKFRLIHSLRNRVRLAIKNCQKVGSAVADLGCSIQHLKLHLELFWDKGMTWKNYGNKKGQWNIDHIIPLTSPNYNLSNREDYLKLNHYTNLQPLWVKDNIRKKDKEIV